MEVLRQVNICWRGRLRSVGREVDRVFPMAVPFGEFAGLSVGSCGRDISDCEPVRSDHACQSRALPGLLLRKGDAGGLSSQV